METYEVSIIEVVISAVLLITWLVAVAQIITIRRTVSRRYSHIAAEHEAEICLLAGDKDGYLRNYYRALYLYWIGSPYFAAASNHELLKKEMKERYYDIITRSGGTYPTKYLPADSKPELLAGIDALYKAGQYTKAEYEAEKSRILAN